MRQGPGWVVTLLLAALVAAAASRPGVRRADCFPLETLGVDRARESEALLLRALDSEALYTLVGGLKPVSSGFATFFPDSDGRLDLAAIARTEALLSAWHCGGEIVAGVYKFERADERGQFYADAIVGHAGATRSVRATHAAFFSPYQLAHNATPLDVVRAVEHDTPLRRWRGYGYLYGYPAYAVDFFVAAEEERARTGVKVDRDFVSVPIHGDLRERFAWAVPRGHVENDDDRAIRARAAGILDDYERRRALYIGEGKSGALALLRDAFDDGHGSCSPGNWSTVGRLAVGRAGS